MSRYTRHKLGPGCLASAVRFSASEIYKLALRKPNRSLLGKRPLDLLESDVGARMVEQVLGRIEYGLGA